MKYLYIIFAFLLFSLLSPQLSLAAEGDLVWRKTSGGVYSFADPKVVSDSTGVYVAGTEYLAGNYSRWRIEKRDLTSGDLVPSFGIGGVVTSGLSSRDRVNDIAIDSAGIYIVGSHVTACGWRRWRIEKRGFNGLLIWSKADTSFPCTVGPGYPYGVAVDGSGVYVVGEVESPTGDSRWRIEKRNLGSGDLVPSFGSGGAVFVDLTARGFPYSDDVAYDVAVDSTGLYIVGFDSSMDMTAGSWRIEKRNLNTGVPISTFGVNGVIKSNPSSLHDFAMDVVVDDTGIYVGGYFTEGSGATSEKKWRLEKRNLSTGALIPSFGADGVIVDNPFRTSHGINEMAVNDSGLYLVGNYALSSWPLKQRIEKRDFNSGVRMPSFGVDGAILSTPFYGNELNLGIFIDRNNRFFYVTGKQTRSDYITEWTIEKRAVITVPDVESPTATLITSSGAMLGANVTANGGAPITARGTCWGTTTNPTTNCTPEGGTAIEEAFSHSRTGMPAGTLIYYRGYATNSVGTGYSPTGSFTTSVVAVPTGAITPTNCTITSGTTCTASIAWTTSSVSSPNIKNNGVTFNTAPSHAGFSTTLAYGLNTLRLYDGTDLLDTEYAFGVASDQGAGGPSCGGSFTSQPTTGLCTSGTVSPVVPTGSGWGWTCGTGVGQIACTATNIGSVCPNSICEIGESMFTCPQDCGASKVKQF